jgi:mono/diheme cytochrome c family protein
MLRFGFASTLTALAALAVHAEQQAAPSFTDDVLPVIANSCFACHGPDGAQRKADLRLDVETDAKAEVIVAGNAADSELIRRITATDPDVRMPPPDSTHEALTDTQIAAITKWIDAGAPWSKHWSHNPPERPDTPDVSDPSWAQNDIDRFVTGTARRKRSNAVGSRKP